MAKKKAEVKWSDVKRPLQSLEAAELCALIQGLFKLSVENRAFLAARLVGASAAQTLLQPYRDRIQRAFYTRGGIPQLKLSEGRKAIREYHAATDDSAGSLELMMTFVEIGTDFTSEFGSIDQPFYNSLSAVLHDMDQILTSELYRGIRERVLELPSLARRIGWGYGDQLLERVADWEQRFGDAE